MRPSFTILLLLLFSCKQPDGERISQTASEQDAPLTFAQFSTYNASVPLNYEAHTAEVVQITTDSCFLKKLTFQKGVQVASNTLASYAAPVKNKAFFQNFPKEYVGEDQVFGGLGDEADGGGIQLILQTRDGENMRWLLSFDSASLPENMRFCHEYYEEVKSKLTP